QVEVVLLHVLAVIAFAVREAEQALLHDRIAAVPQREREAHALLVVGDPGETVLAPSIGARSRLVVREVLPRAAVVALVLAHRSPLSLAEVGTPALPRRPCVACFFEPSSFRVHVDIRRCLPPWTSAMRSPTPSRPIASRARTDDPRRARRCSGGAR